MTSEVEERPTLVMGGYGRHRRQWVKEVQYKIFCLPVKSSCLPAEKVNEIPEMKQAGGSSPTAAGLFTVPVGSPSTTTCRLPYHSSIIDDSKLLAYSCGSQHYM